MALPGGQDNAGSALRLYQAAGHRTGEAWALNNLGFLAAQAFGDYSMALDYCRRALAVHQELNDVHGEANALDSIAYAHAHLGEYEQAVECYQRSAKLLGNQGDRYYLAATLVRLGEVPRPRAATGT